MTTAAATLRGKSCATQPRQDRRIVITPDDGPRRGAVGNFSWLLQEARRDGADYVLPADQDDIWQSDKVARQVQALQAAETGGARGSAIGLLRRRGGRCRGAAGACVVPPSQPAALQFRPAVENAAGPQLRAGLRLCREPPAHGTRPAAARGRGLARLVAGPLRGECGPDHVPRCSTACVSPSRGERQPVGRLECLRGSPAEWRRRWKIGWESFLRSIEQANALRNRLQQRNVAGGAERDLLEAYCRIVERPGSWRRLRELHRLGVPAIDWPRRLLFDVCMLRL